MEENKDRLEEELSADNTECKEEAVAVETVASVDITTAADDKDAAAETNNTAVATAADEADTASAKEEKVESAHPIDELTAEEKAEEQPEKVFCVKCGAEIAPGNAFCPKCGQKVGEKIAEVKTSSEAKPALAVPAEKKKIGMIAGIAAAVIVLIAAFFVIRGVQAKSITINKKDVSVKAGETTLLTYTIDPENTKDKTVTWASSNESIATVSGGNVTGVNEGECSITVKTKNGKTDTCTVTVLPAGPDLQALYNEYCTSTFASIASDGSYLYIDTNPDDKDDKMEYEAYVAIMSINEALGLPESVLNKMNQTRSIDGMQSYSTDELDISWTYHPNKGLEVSYAVK